MNKLTLLTCIICIAFSAAAQDAAQSPPPVEKNRVIKADFFSPLTGNLTLGYEQPLMNSISLTGSIGLIGVSVIDLQENQKGVFVKAGARFYFTPDYWLDGMKRTNDFQGAYFNPEIIYSGFGFDYPAYNQSGGQVTKRGTNNSFALMLELGKQWVIAKSVSLDLYGGIGYGGSSIYAPDYSYYYSGYSDPSSLAPYKFSHLQPDNKIPVALNAGFTIGVLLR